MKRIWTEERDNLLRRHYPKRDLTNLYLLSRADNARRRVREETPEARKARLAKAQTSRNKSIRRDKLRLHWGMQPLGKLVKRW